MSYVSVLFVVVGVLLPPCVRCMLYTISSAPCRFIFDVGRRARVASAAGFELLVRRRHVAYPFPCLCYHTLSRCQGVPPVKAAYEAALRACAKGADWERSMQLLDNYLEVGTDTQGGKASIFSVCHPEPQSSLRM